MITPCWILSRESTRGLEMNLTARDYRYPPRPLRDPETCCRQGGAVAAKVSVAPVHPLSSTQYGEKGCLIGIVGDREDPFLEL